MHQFAYWYIYYDSLFKNKQPIANSQLTDMISVHTVQWPTSSCVLPELCAVFSELQTFILDQKNWSQSICTIQELNKTEADVTNVLLLLQIQKMYILQFWNISKRRVEASITHLYAILQSFVGAIVPYNNMTLFQCKAANKLCVKIINLQNLFKSFMKKINQICAFFQDSLFDEEDQVLRNFFQNLVTFMKMIPKIKKARMFHVSDLLKYLLIINTIQTAVMTIGDQKRIKESFNIAKMNYYQKLKRRSSFNCLRKNKYFNSRKRKKHFSCPNRYIKQNENEHFEKTKRLLRFIFPSWIRRHSIKHRKQSIPKLYIQSVVTKGKSNSQFKRVESPKDSKKKIRNKSVTKIRTMIKSLSVVQSTDVPLKQHQAIMRNNSAYVKSAGIQNLFDDEDQQCNLCQEAQSLTFIKSQQVYHINDAKPLFNVHKMNFEMQQDQNNADQIIKDYLIAKQIEDIMRL